MSSRFGAQVLALVALGCGGAPTGHTRTATRSETDTVQTTLAREGASRTVVDARAIGGDARVLVLFVDPAGSSAPYVGQRACAGSAVEAPPPPAPGCATAVLARMSPSLDAIEAQLALGSVCATSIAPAAWITDPQFEAADLDGDGRLEVALAFDTWLSAESERVRRVRVIDVDTFAVELVVDLELGPDPSASPLRRFGFQSETHEGVGLIVVAHDLVSEDDEYVTPGRFHAPRRGIRIGPTREPFEFEDLAADETMSVVAYDAASDCWPYRGPD